ncbi:hypothetical protein KKA03_01595, partial [archaeon]|nr:hypothetical protein [archaeon]
FYNNSMTPVIKPLYNILWATALAAVGLNADAKELLSNNGTKAILMAFAGFFAATFTFFIGLYII